MKDLLFEKIINDINSIIVENLSISNELSKSAYKVIDEIKKDIQTERPHVEWGYGTLLRDGIVV